MTTYGGGAHTRDLLRLRRERMEIVPVKTNLVNPPKPGAYVPTVSQVLGTVLPREVKLTRRGNGGRRTKEQLAALALPPLRSLQKED